MGKKLSMNEWLFVLGTYSNLNVQEKYRLFYEMAETFVWRQLPEEKETRTTQTKLIKKLSTEKKASFVRYLEALDVGAELKNYQDLGIGWTTILSEDYPSVLSEIAYPPVVLFYKGNFTLVQQHDWLGVVGARDNSDYGVRALNKILPPLFETTNKKIGIVSGLARGIDAHAHHTCIQNGGRTIGVIGTGLDRKYPYENSDLQTEMEESHLVLSEYPVGAKPFKHHFPERNRIIAGLSRGVLVVEAKKRSGSLITAYNAIDENRDVFAVPGGIFHQNSEGGNRLIQLGGILTLQAEDILKEWFYI